MRNTAKRPNQKTATGLIIDETLDAQFGNRVLFPKKIEKARQLLGPKKQDANGQ